jgi:hypothetical protein
VTSAFIIDPDQDPLESFTHDPDDPIETQDDPETLGIHDEQPHIQTNASHRTSGKQKQPSIEAKPLVKPRFAAVQPASVDVDLSASPLSQQLPLVAVEASHSAEQPARKRAKITDWFQKKG